MDGKGRERAYGFQGGSYGGQENENPLRSEKVYIYYIYIFYKNKVFELDIVILVNYNVNMFTKLQFKLFDMDS